MFYIVKIQKHLGNQKDLLQSSKNLNSVVLPDSNAPKLNGKGSD